MVQTAPKEWSFSLISPLAVGWNTEFRFCRNGDCENGLSRETGLIFFAFNMKHKLIQLIIDQWQNYEVVSWTPSS